MAGEEFLDAAAIFVELDLQDAQLSGFCHGIEAFGFHHAGVDVPLAGFGEGFQPGLIGLWPSEFVRVQEFLPLALARFVQGFGAGKAFDEGPGVSGSPVVKGLPARRGSIRAGPGAAD